MNHEIFFCIGWKFDFNIGLEPQGHYFDYNFFKVVLVTFFFINFNNLRKNY